jgi:sigma54-dependent transcription regulator
VLFLDEVSEMSLSAQAKFLRVLQEREFQRLGGTRPLKANIRVVAARMCHRRERVAEGRLGRRDRFETVNAQTPGKTGHHPRPEDKARQQHPQPNEICKTSIPGSNPGGASNPKTK